MLVPEPEGDIRAQINAVLNPEHPKRACFTVRENYDIALPPEAYDGREVYSEPRLEGCLFTVDKELAEIFRRAPHYPPAAFDAVMAEILGYPEPKGDVIRRCSGRLFVRARAVQARNASDWVVHEALTSPAMLDCTLEELQKHVPSDGRLVVLTPTEALGRRLLLREAGK